jgi:hypothetical protein
VDGSRLAAVPGGSPLWGPLGLRHRGRPRGRQRDRPRGRHRDRPSLTADAREDAPWTAPDSPHFPGDLRCGVRSDCATATGRVVATATAVAAGSGTGRVVATATGRVVATATAVCAPTG